MEKCTTCPPCMDIQNSRIVEENSYGSLLSGWTALSVPVKETILQASPNASLATR